MKQQLGKALIRTLVPLLVGAIISLSIFKDVNSSDLSELITLIVAGAYYTIAAVLERYVNFKFGWLLGSIGPPRYDDREVNE